MSNLGMSHKEFWDMPFFMIVDLVKKSNPTIKEPMSRKEVLASMRYNKEKRGWV